MNAAPAHSEAIQQTHLTEDQLDDHLIGDLAPSAANHLASCDACTARVAESQAPLTSFRVASLAWGERHSATAPIPKIGMQHFQWQRSLMWSLAVSAFAVGLGLTSVGRHANVPSNSPEASEAAYTEPTSTPSANQLSSDNQMLDTIDNEISSSNENSAALELMPVKAARPSSVPAVLLRSSVQD